MRLPPRILPITPGLRGPGGVRGLLSALGELKSAGARGVLLREPELTDAELLELATGARELFCDGWLGVADRLHIALAVSADAVHLGFRSMRPVEVRAMELGGLAIGHSQHADELAQTSMMADYRLLGPLHQTASKEGWVEPLGLDALEHLPLASTTWVVGGIGPGEVAPALATGVAGIAAIGAIFHSEDIGRSMAALLSAAEGGL